MAVVIEDELGEDGEPLVVFEQDQLRSRLAPIRFGGLSSSVVSYQGHSYSSPEVVGQPLGSSGPSRRPGKGGRDQVLTRRFFSATNTLGAETTAMVMSSVAPSSSCSARSVAVSSEYYSDC